jgi:hypothetical protein
MSYSSQVVSLATALKVLTGGNNSNVDSALVALLVQKHKGRDTEGIRLFSFFSSYSWLSRGQFLGMLTLFRQ